MNPNFECMINKRNPNQIKNFKRCLYIDILRAMLHVPHFFSFLPIFHFTLSPLCLSSFHITIHNQILILLTLLPKNQRKSALNTSDNLTLIPCITLVSYGEHSLMQDVRGST